jgi:hypothetical protein
MAQFERFDVTGLSSAQIAEVQHFIDKLKAPQARAVGRDGDIEEPFRSILAGAEPSVGNDPMKETRVGKFTDYKPE